MAVLHSSLSVPKTVHRRLLTTSSYAYVRSHSLTSCAEPVCEIQVITDSVVFSFSDYWEVKEGATDFCNDTNCSSPLPLAIAWRSGDACSVPYYGFVYCSLYSISLESQPEHFL